MLRLATVFDFGDGLASFRDDLEREVLYVRLDFSIIELATDEALGIEDGVVGVHRDLVLRGVSDETLRVGKGDIRGRRSIALVVGDDFWRYVRARAGGRGGESLYVPTRSFCHTATHE